MSISDLKAAFRIIDEHQGDFDGPKTGALIDKAEQVLGIPFPPTYREFLLQYGCGDIFGIEFFGLIHEDFQNSGIPDAVWLTLTERESGATNFIIISESGDGAYYVLNSNEVNDAGEYPVLLLSVGGGSETVSEDFGAFMLDKIKNAIA